MSDHLIRGATLLHLDPPGLQQADVRVTDGLISEVGPGLLPRPGEGITDVGGRWVMPGLVCAHTHLYSALACGMPGPKAPVTSFTSMLEQVWWRLDEALDLEAVRVSALVGGLQALRAGVTTLVDHHASPSAIVGSLEALDESLEELGLRRVLCYEVTDRGGPEKARAGLQAHERLLARGATTASALMIGAHANFTLSDETLAACGAMAKEAGVGVHIHVAEANDDRETTGEPLVARMERLGALRPGSMLAHCVHLSPEELARVQDAGAWVSHQPRSNMNNAVGYARVGSYGPRTALGTDGIGADMFAELQTGWYRAQEGSVGWSPERWLETLAAGASFAGDKLGLGLGKLTPGAAGDLVVLDPVPGPPLSAGNLPAAWIFRFTAAMVRSVMVGGRWRLWERDPLGMDLGTLDARAQQAASRLWARMA